MTTPLRAWWRNCAVEEDAELRVIDGMEDRLGSVGTETARVRELISSLEICHHKAARWIDNIVEAIGTEETRKGLGTRSTGRRHPAEDVWQDVCAALSAWCGGRPAAGVDLTLDSRPASELLACLGEHSPLREWQVQRVIDKVRSTLLWQQPQAPGIRYDWLLLGGGEYESTYHEQCPENHREHAEFWRTTARTIIRDTESGEAADLSLALAIDMLWPCHWGFMDNLQLVLGAIGGELEPDRPFAACGRNIGLLPIRPRMEAFSRTLRAFCDGADPADETDPTLRTRLGEPTPVKRWLAASLDKTIRLQLDPPDALRAMSALTGPDWIRA